MSFLERAWYGKAAWLILLWPVSLLFQILASVRRNSQRLETRPDFVTVPVIVVGNIAAGGTGKTPLIMSLLGHFKEQGLKPGVISRGYGGSANAYPMAVDEDSDVLQSGDEALLIARNSSCPVVVDPDRNAALRYLLSEFDVDVVLSDDGLQHYKLYRDIEIALVDGQRQFGNGFCFPAGPLREPVSRLSDVDYIVINGEQDVAGLPDSVERSRISLAPRFLVNLATGEKRPFAGAPFNMGNTVQAVSAIGNPDRFYQILEKLPYQTKQFSFPDHYVFSSEDFEGNDIDEHQPVVMTEKDAVKCEGFARANFWCLTVDTVIDDKLLSSLDEKIKSLSRQEK